MTGIAHLIEHSDYHFEIYENEMSIIENDYRDKLLSELLNNTSIKVLDYSSKADNIGTFLDYSHFTEYGAYKISKNLAKDLFELFPIELGVNKNNL